MKQCLTHWLAVGLLAVTATAFSQESTFVLEGDLSAYYADGTFVVWTPKPEPEEGQAATSMAAASTMTAAADSIEASLNVIARAPLGADGTFRVEAPVDTPRPVYFYVLDALSHEGMRLAPTKGNGFILEPGNLRLHMTRPGRFYIEGGPYNDAVYNSWRRSDDYLAGTSGVPAPGSLGRGRDRRRAPRARGRLHRGLLAHAGP